MPAWVLPLIWRFVLPEVIALLLKYHFINAPEALVAEGAVNLEQALSQIKTYREYPDDPKPITTTRNFNETGGH